MSDQPPTRQDAHRGAEMARNVEPNHLSLGEVIDRLKAEDPGKRLRLGFGGPHSYRGYYHDLAFELNASVTVGEMLAAAESALGATFQGWKGGDYVMKEFTDTWLVTQEGDCGESLGAVLLELMLADGLPAGLQASTAGERTEQQWCVWYGGPDPDNAAGRFGCDDEGDAQEALQWVRDDLGAGIAVRDLAMSPWRVVDPGVSQ